MVEMKYENVKYAEIRSLRHLGYAWKDDDADLPLQQERESRERTRRKLKKELVQLEKQKKSSNAERMLKIQSELDSMQEQDQAKLIEYEQTWKKIAETSQKYREKGVNTPEWYLDMLNILVP